MDLGIAGRSAIICASSQGLGRACAEALVTEGVHVVINGRDADKLAVAAEEIRSQHPGATVVPVAADITTADGRAVLLASVAEPGMFGATCAFVCSDHASFMSGMNIHLDGGSYAGVI